MSQNTRKVLNIDQDCTRHSYNTLVQSKNTRTSSSSLYSSFLNTKDWNNKRCSVDSGVSSLLSLALEGMDNIGATSDTTEVENITENSEHQEKEFLNDQSSLRRVSL